MADETTDGPTDSSCGALSNLAGLSTAVLHRFVVGRDTSPSPIDPAQLADPFAQVVLNSGPFPRTAEEVVSRFTVAHPPNDPRSTERSFLVGEGSQLPLDVLPPEARSIRLVVALGATPTDLILSTFRPDSTSVEVMAWDADRAGFNYYRTTRSGAWVFGGNSRDAFEPDTEGKGPFESHTGGNFLMKELRFPWVHWHSPAAGAPVDPAVLPQGIASHRWARTPEEGGTLLGAEVCEIEIAMPAIARWTSARFAEIGSGAAPLRPHQLMRHVVTSPTVNLVSSSVKASAIATGTDVDLPSQFFLDSETLTGNSGLDLDPPPSLTVPSGVFRAVIDDFDVHLSDGGDLRLEGDTVFPFVVPERAFEDISFSKACLGLMYTDRLLASLLLVDFPNPVFSPVREPLLDVVTKGSDSVASPEAFSEVIAERIRSGASDLARSQFLDVWDAGDKWRDVANARLARYYKHLTDRLTSDPLATFRDWFRVAESRRRRAVEDLRMPIFEFPLLLARCNIPESERFGLREDGTISRTIIGT